MTDVLIDTLRLRGAGANRLARVAATTLPLALERALMGLPDGRLDDVTVSLEHDVLDSDDATIATIWADAIRVAVARQLPTDGKPDARQDTAHVSPGAPVGWAEAMAAARAWLSSGDRSAPLPREALALGPLVEAARLAHAAVPQGAAATVLEIAARLPNQLARRHGTGDAANAVDASTGVEDSRPPAPRIENASAAPGVPTERTSADSAPRGSTSEPPPVSADAAMAAAHLTALSALIDGARGEVAATQLDPTTVTRAAGLALLYPWLADVCRAAVELHPGLDAPAVRALALAALVDPDDLSLADDPLVALLAGAHGKLVGGRGAQVAVAHEDDVRAIAAAALASFAALLPGFESSTADFVRREWIQRLGVLEPQLSPVRLTAHTHPLDVVLSRLPYPLGLFRLPWAEPVMVRFRP